ncbi:TGF-beta-activated kinase 1 and MAP3K7-binding protein 3 [Microcaecilia unicolor]|uniref:TGF-beta-activated kinase 1 and MAP3K7-binding protein 3 n=1 Tax=Microcaecilia unicolor TaxID=1415580 RepID=A0A6P7XZC0_9AMPH|nr:TGF-beta-activated kinase 1 and MAP3K7-binding protein 3 [Microcaecilia unicolor]XP_030058226.1 TGF-beta-activated kinase 1 and MAP3K7-binding protein 3 [Microcaecilia unicolor]
MAQSGQQLDIQILNDLQNRFPEIPHGVVSRCFLQNNNNVEACCRALAQESSKYLYMDYYNSDETRTPRNHLLHINVGIHPPGNYQSGEGTQVNGGRTLVHSSSDGHIDPQCTTGKQQICLVQEPHSAPAVVTTSPSYNPFFLNEQGRNTPTPPPQPASLQPGMNTSAPQGLPPSYMPVPRYSTMPITVTLSPNIVSTPLQIFPPGQSNLYRNPNSIYIRQTSQSSPGRQILQNTPWHSSSQGPVPHYPSPTHMVYGPPQNYQPSQFSPKQTQIPQSAFQPSPTSQCSPSFGSPQHQVQPNQTSQVFMPPSPSAVPPHSYQHTSPNYPKQGGHSVSYLPYGPSLSKGSMKKIEITVEPSQRPGTAVNRSPSPKTSQPSQRSQHPLYPVTTPNSPSRGIPAQSKPPFSVNPLCIKCTQAPGHTGTPTPSSHVMFSQPNSTVLKITVGPALPENILNLVDQDQQAGAPEPIQPISLVTGSGSERGRHKYQRSTSSGSDEYAYMQALLLHQRARMERLAKALAFEKDALEILKLDVNGMEHDLMQRRLRRVSCTTSNPTPEEMTRLRCLNRQLQINIDCTLKEVDLLQSRGIENFDPKAMSNFYDNLPSGPFVPPKPRRKDHQPSSKQRAGVEQRDEDFEGAAWNCDSCTFLNHPLMNRCEQCEMPRYT